MPAPVVEADLLQEVLEVHPALSAVGARNSRPPVSMFIAPNSTRLALPP